MNTIQEATEAIQIQQQRVAEQQRVIAQLERRIQVDPDDLRRERIILREILGDLGGALRKLQGLQSEPDDKEHA